MKTSNIIFHSFLITKLHQKPGYISLPKLQNPQELVRGKFGLRDLNFEEPARRWPKYRVRLGPKFTAVYRFGSRYQPCPSPAQPSPALARLHLLDKLFRGHTSDTGETPLKNLNNLPAPAPQAPFGRMKGVAFEPSFEFFGNMKRARAPAGATATQLCWVPASVIDAGIKRKRSKTNLKLPQIDNPQSGQNLLITLLIQKPPKWGQFTICLEVNLSTPAYNPPAGQRGPALRAPASPLGATLLLTCRFAFNSPLLHTGHSRFAATFSSIPSFHPKYHIRYFCISHSYL